MNKMLCIYQCTSIETKEKKHELSKWTFKQEAHDVCIKSNVCLIKQQKVEWSKLLYMYLQYHDVNDHEDTNVQRI